MSDDQEYKVVRLNALFKCVNPECPQAYESNGVECMRCMIQHQWRTDEALRQMLLSEMRDELAEKLNEGATEDDVNLAVRGLPDIQPKKEMNEEELEFLSRDDIWMLIGIREWKGEELEKAKKLLAERKKDGKLIVLD